jgi:hypothetical protein
MPFYYKDIQIDGAMSSTGGIVYKFTSANVTNSYNMTATSGATSAAAPPYQNINEMPSPLGYSYQGTDISSYAVARYIELVGGQSTTTFPSWCKKIRAVIVGAGGGGGQIQQLDQQWHNSGYNNGHSATNKFYHNSDIHQHIDGGGGGGAGFIYINNSQVTGIQSLQAYAGTGGGLGAGGQASQLILTVNGTANQFLAGGGGGANAATAGVAGGIIINAPTVQQQTGWWNGQGGTNGTAQYKQGQGGDTGAIQSGYPANSGYTGYGGGALSQGTGEQGYVRIYYLTD